MRRDPGSSAIAGTRGLTESGAFPPTHPVTRLDRVVQQLRSFGQLHSAELEAVAVELESIAPDVAGRLRAFQAMQRDEGQLVVEELADIRADLARGASESDSREERIPLKDPAVDSPKRARWLAEQAARDEQLRRPRSRRQLLRGIPHADGPTPEV
jgi:hypothetical protein